MIKEIKNNLKELGFNNNEIKVYTALTQLGEATAAQIAKKSDIPRTTAISILDKLANNKLLTTHVYRGKTYYWIESPQTLKESFVHKTVVAEQLSDLLNDLYRSEAHFPYSKTFDTKTGIKNFIEKNIANLKKKSTIYTIDSPGSGNYAKIYSENFSKIMLAAKKNKQIFTKSLVPAGSLKSVAEYKIKNQNIEIRELPSDIKFEASLWIIENKIFHFSGNPPFIVMIKQDLIYSGIKSFYDYFWNISRTS